MRLRRRRRGGAPAGVVLTFDDGPSPVWTPRVLDALASAGAPATFFVLGPLAAEHPELIARMRAEGHEVGLHGHRHLRHDEQPASVIAEDTARALAIMPGPLPRLWRPPHGIVTQATRDLAAVHGLEIVGWTADTVDWQDGETAASLLARVEPLLQPGAIILMHDAIGPGAPRADAGPTVELIAPLVAAIRARGLVPELVPQKPARGRRVRRGARG